MYTEILYVATHNPHKVEEIGAMLAPLCQVHSAAELGSYEAPEETADTLQGNALIKAESLHKRYGCRTLADDTGLLVDALDGAPGVYSARYGGVEGDDRANRERLLRELEGHAKPWTARFETVLIYIDLSGVQHCFVGEVRGEIVDHEVGDGGFGYDSLFVPEGYSETFAQMSPEQKNLLSHRSRAVAQLRAYLETSSIDSTEGMICL